MQTDAGTTVRERKKRVTNQKLSLAARELVHERGLDGVTVDDIAAAADVSRRTFFNYFSCKEEAVVGFDPAVVAEIADELRRRPASESARQALRAVLFAEVEVEGMLRRWQLLRELVRAYPALLPRHLASLAHLEEALVAALAERLGTDPRSDPSPRVLVAAALAVTRSTLAWWWEDSDRHSDLTEVMDRTFAQHVIDLPRNA